jgi:hypothetical protein
MDSKKLPASRLDMHQGAEVTQAIHAMLANVDKYAGPVEVLIPLVDLLFATNQNRPASTAPHVIRALSALLGNLFALRAALSLAHSQFDQFRESDDYEEFTKFLKEESGLDLEPMFAAAFAKGATLEEDIARMEGYKALFIPGTFPES